MQVFVCPCAAEPKLVLSLALLGKLCVLGAGFITILYSIELFPTVVRYGDAVALLTSLPVNLVLVIQAALHVPG